VKLVGKGFLEQTHLFIFASYFNGFWGKTTEIIHSEIASLCLTSFRIFSLDFPQKFYSRKFNDSPEEDKVITFQNNVRNKKTHFC